MQIEIRKNLLENIYGITPEYPYVMHETDTNDFFVPWHWHEELEFDFIAKGSVKIVTNNGEYFIDENEAFFCNTNVLSKMEKGKNTQRVVLYTHLFNEIFLSGHFKSIFRTKYLDPILNNKNIEIIKLQNVTPYQKEIVYKLKKLSNIQKESENIEFETRNLLSEIWGLLLQEVKTNYSEMKNVDLRNQEKILELISFINLHYTEKISLDDISASANISTRECLRCFKKNIKKTPFEYLMEVRINKSLELLKYTDKSIVDIGFETGFSSNAYFGKRFKEFIGMSPGVYRKILRRKEKFENTSLP